MNKEIDTFNRVAFLCFYAPIAEEYVRRMLQDYLHADFGLHAAVWICAGLFVLCHTWRFKPFALVALLSFAAIGYLYDTSGLIFAIGVHSGYNFGLWLIKN